MMGVFLWLWLLLQGVHTDAACSVNTTALDLAADSGTFVSHEGYGSVDYDNDQNCEWLITVSAGWVVRLIMEDFDLYGGCSDSAKIYDGNSISDPLIGEYCGTYDPFPNIPNSSSNQILIVFRTNSFLTGFGFQYSWVRSMVTFSEYRYTGRVVEGRTGSSNVTFSLPPHAEGGAGEISYSLVGSLSSKLSIDSNTAAVRLSGETHVHCCLGDPNDLVQTDKLGIRATDADGDFATVPVRVKLYATTASALVGSLIVASSDLDTLMKVKLDSGEIRFISGTESPSPLAVGLDSIENWLYWGDQDTDALMRIQVTDQEEQGQVFYQLQPGARPHGIFVDSENRTLYYADTEHDIIGSVDMSSKEHTVLLQLRKYAYPRAVVVDDSREYLYFTIDGRPRSVSRLSLINGVTEVLLDSSLSAWPYGLAINNTIGRLYVCDTSYREIIQLNVDGSERSTLSDNVQYRVVALENNVLYVWSISEKITVLDADTGDVLRVYDTAGLGNIFGIAISPGETVIYFGASHYTAVAAGSGSTSVTLVPDFDYFGGVGAIAFSLEGQYSAHFTIDAVTGEIMALTSLYSADLSPMWTDGDRQCFGSRTSADLTLTLQDSVNEVARVVVIPCTPRPDPCAVNRGGCDQYCTSRGDEVTCVCSDSFVLSSTDSKTCNDPCEADNGGCSQLCTVDSHQVVCECQDGYNVDPADGTICVEVNECEDGRCANGGNCKDLVNMFICSCTPTWAGRYCTQEVSFEPAVENISPLKGPVAGQSRLTLTGDHFVDGVLVRLGDDHACTYYSSGGTSAVVLTPPVDESYSNKPLPVSVHFPGFTRQTTPFIFTYKGNPTLSSVKPLESQTIGGTRLTVAGQDLDVVSDPVLQITMVHTYKDGGNTMKDVTIYNSPCKVESGTKMSCLTPKVQIPDSFKNWDQNRTNRKRRSSDSVHSAGRRNGENKRYPRAVQQETDLTIRTPYEALDFYIGFKLDGVTTYKNLSDTKDLIDYGKVTYYSVAPIVDVSEFEPLVPNTGMTIRITGMRFLDGFTASDYKVAIGGGWCNDIEMTANEIICTPPDELPAETTSGEERTVSAEKQDVDVPESRRKRNVPAEKQDVDVPESRRKRSIRKVQADVTVHAGTELKLYAGELTYHITEQKLTYHITEQKLTVILASVFAAVAVVVIISAVIVGCCVYRRKKAAHGPDMHVMSSAGPRGRPAAPNGDDETDYQIPTPQPDVPHHHPQYETLGSTSFEPGYEIPVSQSHTYANLSGP